MSSPLPYGRVPKGPLPYGRVPKGPLPYGRACLRILISRACLRIQNLRQGDKNLQTKSIETTLTECKFLYPFPNKKCLSSLLALISDGGGKDFD